MALQERPYWRKENDDDEPDTQSGSHSYGPYGEPPRIERAAPEPAREVHRPIPAAPALEGVISWRQNEGLVHQAVKAAEHGHETEDDDDEDEDEAPARTTQRPATPKPAEHSIEDEEPADHQAAELDAVVADLVAATENSVAPEAPVVETQERHSAAEEDDTDEDADDTPPPHTARVSQPVAATPADGQHATIRYPDSPTTESLTADLRRVYDTQPAPAPATPNYARDGNWGEAPAEVPAAEPAAEAAPVNLEYEDMDVPPPHTGVTEAVDFPPTAPVPPRFEGGDIPPTPPPEQPAAPYNYNQGPGMYPPMSPAEYVQPSAAPAPRYEQAPVDNHRHGEPLAAAVGLGLVAEHIGRKRADTRQQNQIDRFTEQTGQYQQENNTQYAQMQEQQRRFANEQQRQTTEMQRMQQQQQAQQERYSAAPTPYNLEYAPEPTRDQQQLPKEVRPPTQPNRPFEGQPAGNPLHRQYGSERVPQQQPVPRQELGRPVAAAQPGNAERQPDQQAEQEYMNEVQQPQQKQHVEQSAWHRIVTEHGHEVPGAVQYGQEFYRQREHEMLTDRSTANPVTPGGAAAAAEAAAGQQAQQQPMQGIGATNPMPYLQPGQPGSLPSGMTSPTLPPGPPTHIDPQHQLPAAPSKQVASNIANPWFWIMLILIVAAFFTAALI